jgi:two-component system chemotaxis response regulator CheY
MRSLLISTLEELGGFEITETSSGFEALKFLSREKPDLIITDINMPDISGLELVSFVKRNPLMKSPPHHRDHGARGPRPGEGPGAGCRGVPHEAL